MLYNIHCVRVRADTDQNNDSGDYSISLIKITQHFPKGFTVSTSRILIHDKNIF